LITGQTTTGGNITASKGQQTLSVIAFYQPHPKERRPMTNRTWMLALTRYNLKDNGVYNSFVGDTVEAAYNRLTDTEKLHIDEAVDRLAATRRSLGRKGALEILFALGCVLNDNGNGVKHGMD